MSGTLGRASLGFFAAFAMIAAGCASMRPYDPGPGKRVAAHVPEETYLSGEPVNVTISNLSDVTLFYADGFCKTKLQKRDGSLWRPVSDPSVGCPIQLGFLEPGQSVVHQFRLPKGVDVGHNPSPKAIPFPIEASAPDPKPLTPPFKGGSP